MFDLRPCFAIRAREGRAKLDIVLEKVITIEDDSKMAGPSNCQENRFGPLGDQGPLAVPSGEVALERRSRGNNSQLTTRKPKSNQQGHSRLDLKSEKFTLPSAVDFGSIFESHRLRKCYKEKHDQSLTT